jgi:hypothetical protein
VQSHWPPDIVVVVEVDVEVVLVEVEVVVDVVVVDVVLVVEVVVLVVVLVVLVDVMLVVVEDVVEIVVHAQELLHKPLVPQAAPGAFALHAASAVQPSAGLEDRDPADLHVPDIF